MRICAMMVPVTRGLNDMGGMWQRAQFCSKIFSPGSRAGAAFAGGAPLAEAAAGGVAGKIATAQIPQAKSIPTNCAMKILLMTFFPAIKAK